MSSTCQRQGCTRRARMALTVNVPARGWPLALHQPIRLVIGVRLCKEHAREARAEDMLGIGNHYDKARPGAHAELRRMIEALTQDRAPPDYERAFVSPISIESEEFQNFVAMQCGRSS